MRRTESLSRMCLTLLAALLLGAVLEAEGLRVWAERLEVGALRRAAQPVTAAWADALAPLAKKPRDALLQAKAALAPAMLGRQQVATHIDLASVGELPVSVEAAMCESFVRPPRLASFVSREMAAPSVTRAPLLASPAVLLEVGDGVRVVLAGDSMMAVGLAPALRRGLADDKGVQLLRAYRSGTGLARPEVFDWLQQYPAMLGEARPQLVICAIGANDGQNVQVGKTVLEFGSPEWDAYYRGRLMAYLDMILQPQTRVLWVGMPAMKERRFAQKMRHMNELARSVLAAYPQVSWLDPNPALGYADGVFAQYRAGERGRLVKMRADDGIHMTDDGALYLLPQIRAWLAREAPAFQGVQGFSERAGA